ncbi:hypothetical protein HC928_02675 [bacterium]|nr:hypothetical protein [bacterium]
MESKNTKIKEASRLIYELTTLNEKISSKIWMVAFIGLIARSAWHAGYSWEQFKKDFDVHLQGAETIWTHPQGERLKK